MSLPASPAPGDGRAELRALFREIFEREFDYVWTSLRRLGVHARDLEDITQEVFLQVLNRIDRYDPQRPIRPWLFAFAFRSASDWRRLARHRVEVSDDAVDPIATTPMADEALVRAEDADVVHLALQAIEMDRRAVFILYEMDDCSMKDIAERLGIPLFTAYSRLRLAREEFTAGARRILAKRGAT